MRHRCGLVGVRVILDGYEDFAQEAQLLSGGASSVVVQMQQRAPGLPPIPLPARKPEPKVVAKPKPKAKPKAAPAPAPQPTGPRVQDPALQSGAEIEAGAATQADIEAQAKALEEGRLPNETPPQQGFESWINVGYSLWLDDGPAASNGGPGLQIGLGLRFPWFLSYGVQLVNFQFDTTVDGTQVILGANPGFYLRGHLSRDQQAMGWDVFFGVGFQPVAFTVSVYETQDFDASQIDPLALQNMGTSDVAGAALQQMANIGDTVTVESFNVPIELGATFYVTSGFGLSATLAMTFWVPVQTCLHDSSDALCFDDGQTVRGDVFGTETIKSLFIGGGLTFLP